MHDGSDAFGVIEKLDKDVKNLGKVGKVLRVRLPRGWDDRGVPGESSDRIIINEQGYVKLRYLLVGDSAYIYDPNEIPLEQTYLELVEGA